MRTNNIQLLNNQDLIELKEKFTSSVGYKSQPTDPTYNILTDQSEYRGQPINGLTFPLTIVNGSLSISQNEDRIVQQILETLQTFVGERVYRQFFGMPDLIFESISEAILESRIERQLLSVIKVDNISLSVKVRNLTPEQVVIFVTYQLSNTAPQTLKYLI